MDELTDPRQVSSKYLHHTRNGFHADLVTFKNTRFIIDDCYIGRPPKIQVCIDNLNDNIDESFLRKELTKFGQIRTLEIVRDPTTKKHLGLAKLQFENVSSAKECITQYNKKRLMGKEIEVFADCRFVQLDHRKQLKLNPPPPPKPTVITQIPYKPLPPPSPVISQYPLPLPTTTPSTNTTPTNTTIPPRKSLDERIQGMLLQDNSFLTKFFPTTYNLSSRQQSSNQKENKPEKHITSSTANHTIAPESFAPKHPPKHDQQQQQKQQRPPILLSEELIEALIPHTYNEFIKEFRNTIIATIFRQLKEKLGFPLLAEAQEKYNNELLKEKQAKEKEIANRKIELDVIQRRVLQNSGNKKNQTPNKRVKIERTQISSKQKSREPLKRINRSSAVEPDYERKNFIGRDSWGSNDFSPSSSSYSSKSSSSSISGSSSSSSSRSGSRSRSGSDSDSGSFSSVSSDSRRSKHTYSPINKDVSDTTSDDDSEYQITPQRRKRKKKQAGPKHQLAKVEPKAEELDFKEQDAIGVLMQLRETGTKGSFHNVIEDSIEVDDLNQKVLDISPPKPFIPQEEFIKESPKSRYTYKKRSHKEQQEILNNLYKTLSEEDVEVLQKIHEKEGRVLLNIADDEDLPPFGSDDTNKLHLVPKTTTSCSRCEVIDLNKTRQVIEEKEYEVAPKALGGTSTRRDLRGNERRLAVVNAEIIDPEVLKKMIKSTLLMRAKNLRFSRSHIHKWGLFACEKIAKDDAVIEYVGEKIRHSLADHRETKIYTNLSSHDGSSYFFRVETDVIDATLKGNKARFINHSCNPNCIAKVIRHENGTSSIVIYANRVIQENEEITYNYKFARENVPLEDKIHCNCNAPNCQKYLN